MKTLKKVYRVAHCEGSNWKQELCRFLRNYRATPHPSTGIPPATLLLGRPTRTRLPEILSGRSDPQKLDQAARQRDAEQSGKIKRQADSRDTIKR